jgi:tetratricopeptide (TPR) repeat protein
VPTPTAPREPTAAELFPACQSAVAAGAWQEAIAACERVRAKDAAFAGLADALATAYVNHGKQRRDQADGLPAAIEAFDQALAVKPDDPEALKQRQLAVAFQEGEAALAAGDFAGAIERWQEVFGAEPTYREAVGDGGVRDRLYRALLGGGQAALEAGRYAEAQQQCERALELVGDSSEAQACRQAAIAAQRPPTVAPPGPAPRVQPTQPARQPAQPQPTPPPRAQPTQPPRAQPTPPPAPQPTQPPRVQPTPAPAPPTRAPAPVQVPPTRPPY